MSQIVQQIDKDAIVALKAHDALRVSALRMLKAAIKNVQIDNRGVVFSDEDAMSVIRKEIKKRNDAIEQYTAANRPDLASKEQEEINVMQPYLPTALGSSDIHAIIDSTIRSLGADSAKDFGRVMKEVMAKTQGRADGKMVSELLRSKLSS